MIGQAVVLGEIERELVSPPQNGDFSEGLDGWSPYVYGSGPTSGPWTVDADGAVHPTTPAGGRVGLIVAPSGMIPRPTDKTQVCSFTLVGHTPVAGTVTLLLVSAESTTDPAPTAGTWSGMPPVAVPAGEFTVTGSISYAPNSPRPLRGPGFSFLPTITDPYPDLSTFTVTRLTMTRPDSFTDIGCLIDRVAIRHGRDDATGQPDASTATIDLSYDSVVDPTAPGLLAALDIGSGLRVFVTLDGTDYTRFVGQITDIAITWDDAGTQTPHMVGAQLMAASPLARLGRTIIGDTPWPQELDGARAGNIFRVASQRLAGTPVDLVYQTDPGTAQVLPLDVDSQPALDVLHALAESAEGVVWQMIDGTVSYADANRRIGADPAVTLDACDLLVAPTWNRDLAGLVNSVSVGWGDPGDGEQSRYDDSDQISVRQFGLYDYSVGTQLASRDDAVRVVQDMLARQSTPGWNLTELPLGVEGLDAPRTAQVLALDMHALIELVQLPDSAGGAPTTAQLWVEGWSETLAAGTHDLTLAVTDYARSAGAVTWDTWGADTWDQTDPTLTWNNARAAPTG